MKMAAGRRKATYNPNIRVVNLDDKALSIYNGLSKKGLASKTVSELLKFHYGKVSDPKHEREILITKIKFLQAQRDKQIAEIEEEFAYKIMQIHKKITGLNDVVETNAGIQ